MCRSAGTVGDDPLHLFLLVGSAPRRSLAFAAHLPAGRHVRQRMHETQLAFLYPKQVGIRQSADAESAKRHHRSSRLIGNEAPRGRGTSTDIIEASAKAYVDGLNKLARL